MSESMPSATRASRLTSRITRPLDSWNQLSGFEKYVAYARWSLVSALPFIVAMLLLPFVLDLLALSSTARAWAWTGSGFLLMALVLAGVSVELHPELNTRPRRSHTVFFAVSLAMCAVLWGTGGAVALLMPRSDTAVVCSVFAWVALHTVSLIHAVWLKYRWLITLGGAAVTVVLTHRVVDSASLIWVWVPPFFLGVTILLMWTVRIFREADRARHLEADLALTEERLRIAQELHDTMGQHLAAMSLKTQVALALARRGDARLEQELEELQRLTQVSSKDMRAVVEGFRDINLATEMAGAKTLLENTDIEVRVEGASLDVPERYREVAAWFVRECTTNIVRHSRATTASFTLGTGHIEVVNDGVSKGVGPSSGLASLHRRASGVGGQITTACSNGEFRTVLSFGPTVPS